ncbi:hypothetical protein M3J09_006343 [Ascochyta lentis]
MHTGRMRQRLSICTKISATAKHQQLIPMVAGGCRIVEALDTLSFLTSDEQTIRSSALNFLFAVHPRRTYLASSSMYGMQSGSTLGSVRAAH